MTVDLNSSPIIILSAARSGTTLAARLLNSHPCVAVLGSSVLSALGLSVLSAFHRGEVEAEEMRQLILRTHTDHVASDVGLDYAVGDSTRHTRWGFKLLNSPDIKDARALCSIFPEAKIVAVARDGRAVVASWMDNWALAAGPNLTPNPMTAAKVWVRSMQQALELCDLTIKLEDLADPTARREQTDRLLRLLQLERCKEVDEFEKSPPWVSTYRLKPRNWRAELPDAVLRGLGDVPGFVEMLERLDYRL